MPSDRDKLLQIMDSLESDYADGKISPEKYSYFRSKYEDKLNSIDAKEATQRIRSMQGKTSSSDEYKKKKAKKPAKNKKNQEQDLVQKYIINPKKDDASYNKKGMKSMDSGTFKLLLLLVLVVGFTVGVGYGVFNLDFDNISETTTVAIVTDTAFPDIDEDIVDSANKPTQYNNYTDYNDYDTDDVETTQDSSTSDYPSSSSSNNYPSDSGSNYDGSSSTDISEETESGGSEE